MTQNLHTLEDFADFLESLNIDKSCDDVEALLLTCIDYRFFGKIAKHMEDAGLSGKYDHVIIAGAELGPLVDFPPDPRLHWQQFFLEHLALSKDLHKIKRVILLGHRDCGAYKKFKVLPQNPTLEEERKAHKLKADKLENLIKQFHPKLEVDKFLLSLDGSPTAPLKFQRLA